MSKQPEALRLADALERMSLSTRWDKAAAAELRRLHAANKDCVDHFDALMAERNALLEALVELSKSFIGEYVDDLRSDDEIAAHQEFWEDKARAAIAKATGDKS